MIVFIFLLIRLFRYRPVFIKLLQPVRFFPDVSGVGAAPLKLFYGILSSLFLHYNIELTNCYVPCFPINLLYILFLIGIFSSYILNSDNSTDELLFIISCKAGAGHNSSLSGCISIIPSVNNKIRTGCFSRWTLHHTHMNNRMKLNRRLVPLIAVHVQC